MAALERYTIGIPTLSSRRGCDVSRSGSLPYQARSNRVEEKKLRNFGEVSDLRPGASGHLTLRMKAGNYVLFCNEPGYYKAGMVTVFTVTR